MRYPTMTRILAIFLAFCALGLIFAGGFGIYTANKERKSSLKELSNMQSWAEDYRELDIKLNGESKADEMDEKLKSERESHDEASSTHKRELAEYSAAKSGLQIGSDALIQGDEKLYQGWEQYYKALDMFKEKEREFNEGCAKFEAGKAALSASKTLYAGGVQVIEGTKAILNELDTLDEIFETENMEQAYDRLFNAYENAVYAISRAESAVNDLLNQGLITQEQVQALENEIITAAGISSAEIKAKVQADYDTLLNKGELSEEEFNELKAVYDENKAALAALSLTIKKYIGPAEEKLTGMGTEIQKAEEELKKMEPYMEQGKAAIEEGRNGLKQAETVLIQGEDALVSGEKKLNEEQRKLNEKLPELKEQKEKLETEQAELNDLTGETEKRKTLEGKRTSLSLKLRANAQIRESCDRGTELYEAAGAYISEFEKQIKADLRNEIIMAVILAFAAIAGFAAPAAVFGKEKGRLKRMLMPAICAGISLTALVFGHFSLNIVSSASITALCAAAAVMLSAYPNKKKKEIC